MTRLSLARDLDHKPGDKNDLDVGVEASVWLEFFHTPLGLLFCIIEMLKNCFDWRARTVRIITSTRTEFRVVDNGCGMNYDNRRAFLSVGRTTGGGADQAAKFGTGAKYMMFTFASNVRVVTAPEDEPDKIYVFECTPEQLAEVYSGHGYVHQIPTTRTKAIWPYEHQFGTDITFTLKDPRSRSIHRGARLGRKLADRLDNFLVETGAVLVDDQPLPPKEIVGRKYQYGHPAEANSPMGKVRFEFYRPAKRSPDEDLRMTGRSIGEVSFRDAFLRLLSDEQRDLVPELFTNGDVCGLITAGFLNEHVTEGRTNYDVTVADDRRVQELLRMLTAIEVDVANHLGIKIKRVDDEDVAGRAEVEEAIRRLQECWGPDEETAVLSGVDEGRPVGDPGSAPTPPPVGLPRLSLDGRTEFEVGEVIKAKLTVPGGSTEGFRFYLDLARGEEEFCDRGEVRLIANSLGRGTIRATNPQTGDSAKAEYQVVANRLPHLSAETLDVAMGSHTTVEMRNADRVIGELKWRLTEGRGDLTLVKRGAAARFTPSQGGSAQIQAVDSGRPGDVHVCDIWVRSEDDVEVPFRIRGERFRKEVIEDNTSDAARPVQIISAGEGEVHSMVFNQVSPGYQAALKRGVLTEVLLSAITTEFVKTFEVDYDEFDANDPRGMISQVQTKSAALLEEILEQ